MHKRMKSDFLISIALGLVFGTCVFGLDALFPDKAFIGICLLCLIFGFFTVLLLKSNPNIWAVIVVFVSYPFYVAAFGFETGSYASLGMLVFYGIFCVQSFQALFSLAEDLGWLHGKLFRKKPRA